MPPVLAARAQARGGETDGARGEGVPGAPAGRWNFPPARSFALSSSGWLFVYYVGWSRRWRSADITSAHPSRTARCTRIVGPRLLPAPVLARQIAAARGTFFLENYEDLPALTPRTSALALLQARQGVRHVRRRAHRMSLVPRHRPRRARGVRLHLRRQGAFVPAPSPAITPRRHHAVLHEGRDKILRAASRSASPASSWWQELAQEPVPVVRVSRPIPAVQRVHHSAAGLPMWPRPRVMLRRRASDLQLLKGLARNGTFCKLHCRKTNPKNLVWCAPSTAPGRTSDRASTSPCGGRFFRPSRDKLKELFELAKRTRTRGQISRTKPCPAARPDRARKAT